MSIQQKIMTRIKWRQFARSVNNIRIQEGRLRAIQALRRETDCGLREALHAVERLERVNWTNV